MASFLVPELGLLRPHAPAALGQVPTGSRNLECMALPREQATSLDTTNSSDFSLHIQLGPKAMDLTTELVSTSSIPPPRPHPLCLQPHTLYGNDSTKEEQHVATLEQNFV